MKVIIEEVWDKDPSTFVETTYRNVVKLEIDETNKTMMIDYFDFTDLEAKKLKSIDLEKKLIKSVKVLAE